MTQKPEKIGTPTTVNAPLQRRMVKRVVVRYPASLHTVLHKVDGEIADISPKGAKLKVGGQVDAVGSARLIVENREIFCDIMWSDGENCGIKFERDLPEELLDTIMQDATEQLSPVACADWIPMGTKRGGRLVCEA